VRELSVYSEIVPHRMSAAEMADKRPAAIILSGGPKSVHVEGAPLLDPAVYDLGVPIFGICYGAQLIAQQLGGTVGPRHARRVRPRPPHPHRRIVGAARRHPVRARRVDEPLRCDHRAAAWLSVRRRARPTRPSRARERRPTDLGRAVPSEVVHSPHGMSVLRTFVHELAECAPDVEDGLRRRRAGGASGTRSAASACCARCRAVSTRRSRRRSSSAPSGPQLTCIYVDTGLMRKGESEQVVETFRRNMGIELIHVDAGDRFFTRLAGITEPEAKRKAIGELFIRIFEEYTGGLTEAKFLVQGTLYPDLIESGGADGNADVIKSHHNVGGLPDGHDARARRAVARPLQGRGAGARHRARPADEIVWRQPFPGPGLGVRIIGEVTPDKVATLQEADAIVREEIAGPGLEREIWQAFAVLPDISRSGVMGDERTYGHPIIIRAVTSDDAMTADWARLPTSCSRRCRSGSSTRCRDQPRRLRHHVQAAGHDRVGVARHVVAR
jgi:GMP synthase (glutamine-hydrolysing)